MRDMCRVCNKINAQLLVAIVSLHVDEGQARHGGARDQGQRQDELGREWWERRERADTEGGRTRRMMRERLGGRQGGGQEAMASTQEGGRAS